MSAIGAIFSRGAEQSGCVDRMVTSLCAVPHDQASTWASGPMAIAAAIRHTTAESREQAQPYQTDDGRLAAAFAGYLLNPKELIADLEARGHKFKNHSDVAIALAAYEAWGDVCAHRFEGEFSLIIADRRAERLFIARDHMGFIPLYYIHDAGRLVVATDFRTLLDLNEKASEPDPLYLAQIMANRWFAAEATPWKQIKRVGRASTLTFDGQRLETKRYWEPPTQIDIRYKNDQDYVEHYREMLFDCTRRASRTDAPAGVAVSGGLDSSALYCIANKLQQDGLWQAPDFIGYSLAAEEGSNAFELPFARATAEKIGRELVEVPLFAPDIEWYTKDAQWHQDIPTPSNGAMMLGMDSRVVEDNCRILINGSGGDEWLQGNEQYYREFAAEFDLTRYAQALRRDAKAMGLGRAVKIALRQTAPELTPAPVRRMVQSHLREKRRGIERELVWLNQDLRMALAEAEETYLATLPENGVDLAKHNLVKSPRHDLTHTMMGRQRAKIGLQSRHPMQSRRFIEFSMRTPGYIKRQGGLSKVVHRQAMADLLPQVILDRTTKANFTNTKIDMQFADFVRTHARESLKDLCDFDGLETVLGIDYGAPEGDFWCWEIWGLYATAAFLYGIGNATGFNPATGVHEDRN